MLPLGMTMGLTPRGSVPVDPWYVTLAPKIAQLFLSGPTYQQDDGSPVAPDGLVDTWDNYPINAGITASTTARPTAKQGANNQWYTSFNGTTNVLSGMVPITAAGMLALVRINSGVEMFGDGADRLGAIWFPTVNDLLPTDANSLFNPGTNYANGVDTDVWPGGWAVVGQFKDDGIAVASSGVLNFGAAFGTFSNCDIATACWFNATLTAGERALVVAQMLAEIPT